MYWDIVEVVPKADSSLLVRFKDGLEGLVRLRWEQLTGALEPLRDERFFEQVFIDDGAVAWPGGIDLAPDAMYAEISGKQTEPNSSSSEDSSRLDRCPRYRGAFGGGVIADPSRCTGTNRKAVKSRKPYFSSADRCSVE